MPVTFHKPCVRFIKQSVTIVLPTTVSTPHKCMRGASVRFSRAKVSMYTLTKTKATDTCGQQNSYLSSTKKECDMIDVIAFYTFVVYCIK